MRNRNTNRSGGSFSATVVASVWNKGQVVTGYDPATVRKDTCGALMKKDDYGKTQSKYGWEVDHIQPVSKGGTDDLSNLQPLQWENNRSKGDDYPNWYCAVRSAAE